jgi:hypothetical protein
MRLILVAFAISAAFAQHVEFEVASVKPAINAPFGGGLPNSVPVARLAESISGYVDRPVTDDTGLEGTYSWSLEWSPGESADMPSIFAALQEQLGLKLEPAKGPVEFLVIEHAEKTPVAN